MAHNVCIPNIQTSNILFKKIFFYSSQPIRHFCEAQNVNNLVAQIQPVTSTEGSILRRGGFISCPLGKTKA
jgi:hypothetical protein